MGNRLRTWMKNREKNRARQIVKPMMENMIIYIIKSIFIRKWNVWMMKKKFFLLFNSSFMFTELLLLLMLLLLLLLWLVVELVDLRFCIRNMSIIFSSFFVVIVVVPLLFFFSSSQFSLLLILLFHSPHFSGTVYIWSVSVTNEFGRRRK